jgi:hypothetical protein
MHAEGAVSSGSIGDPDPVLAVVDALPRDQFDEIVVSTLPPGLSRWIRQDLPHRLARRTELPVCHVVADVAALEQSESVANSGNPPGFVISREERVRATRSEVESFRR